MEDLVWKSGDSQVVVPIATSVICFSLYWFVAYSDKLRDAVDNRMGPNHFLNFGAFYQKGLGFVCLGIIPMIIAVVFLPGSLSVYGISAFIWEPALVWLLVLGGVLLIIPYFSARKEEMLEFYPQIRVPEWSGSLLTINAIVWLLYLFAYEFLFRGFLLISVASVLGWWPAIAIATAVSTLTHMPKGSKETFGTIPLSVLLCFIVIQTGAIWPCVIIHAVLAISNDYWALNYHPGMQLIMGKRLEPAKKAVSD